MKKYLIIGVLAFSLTGCQLDKLISTLSTSDVEQGAKESVERAKKREQKLANMEKLTQEYKFNQDLFTTEGHADAFAKYYLTKNDKDYSLHIEMVAPDNGKSFYEVWLVNTQQKKQTSLGVMEYKDTEDYQFTTTIDTIADKSQLMISKEVNADSSPEEVVIFGDLQYSPAE